MSTMRFADEVVPRAEIEDMPRRAKPDAKALKMASQLLEAMATDWKPSRYHDTYTEELKSRIDARDKGKKIVEEEPAEPTGGKVVDLMAALEESVAKAKGGRRGPSRAPSARPDRRAAARILRPSPTCARQSVGRWRRRLVSLCRRLASRRRSRDARVGFVGRRGGGGGSMAPATSPPSRAIAASRLRSCDRRSDATTVITPSTQRVGEPAPGQRPLARR